MSEYRHSHSSRIFWGLVLILIGVLVLFERFGFHDFWYLVSTWWPAVFILIGISILLGNGFRRPGAGLFFIIFGGFFLLWELDILEYGAWHYLWPAGLIALGLWIILHPAFRHHGPEGIPKISGNDLELTCIFSGVKRRVETTAFKGGQVTAIFGGADVDFTRTGLEGGKAVGESGVRIPPDAGGPAVRVADPRPRHGFAHPLTAPWSSAAMIWRWNITKTTRVGSRIRIVPAHSRGTSVA